MLLVDTPFTFLGPGVPLSEEQISFYEAYDEAYQICTVRAMHKACTDKRHLLTEYKCAEERKFQTLIYLGQYLQTERNILKVYGPYDYLKRK